MSRGRKRILFIGGTEKGKSTQIRKLIHSRKEPVIIHNQGYQKAYAEFPSISLEQVAQMKSGKYQTHDPDHLTFFQTCVQNFRNGLLVAEDTSEYLTHTKNMTVYPLLIKLRHLGVDVIMVFHSLADTPKYVLRQCNEVILFKTGDVWKDCVDKITEDKVEEFEKKFFTVKNHTNQFHWERIVIMKTGTI